MQEIVPSEVRQQLWKSGLQFCLHACFPTIKLLHVVGHVLLYLEKKPQEQTPISPNETAHSLDKN